MTFPDLTGGVSTLGKRFSFSGVLPFAFLFLVSAALIVVAGAPRTVSPSKSIAHAATHYGPGGVGAVLAAALIIAVVTQPFQVGVVRLLEGYWGTSTVAESLRLIGVEHQRRRHKTLFLARKDADMAGNAYLSTWLTERIARFPPDEELLPTLLGNTLRSGERTAGERYALDTVRTWTRLYHVLSETVRSDVAELHGQVDAGCRLSVAFAVAALASAPILAPHEWWNLVAPTFGFLSWAAYRSAIASAADLRDVLASAFDLHRFDLLAAMHLPQPRTPLDDQRVSAQLRSMLDRVSESDPFPPGLRYKHNAGS